jgi:putative membrane-bound dehydrogenase-like protein
MKLRLVAAGFLGLSLPFISQAGETKIDGRTFTLPDGFTIEKVAASPLVDRPIEADFDDGGRLYVTDSSGSSDKVDKQQQDKPHRVVRLEDANGDGRFDRQTVFADKMMFPEGAMWLDDSLYVAAVPSIWKLTDSDGDGVADKREEWFQGKTVTGCANDLHGPYAGPDGWIYWCKGAFAEQRYTLPDGKPFVTRAAHIFRCRPDGTGIEPVMTGGMDNPVGIAFTPGGERIFSCTFLQHPGGGKRDGLIHAIYGGVYGKVHDVIDDHVHTSPEVMPVMSHLGPAAPCGLTRYESDVFGPEYQDNLFSTLFNLHKVTRHVLTPDGATFKSADSDFLTCDSLDFHPTDVFEDADGSLLVIDTGGWYKLCCPTSQLHKPDVLGAIYRIRKTGATVPADPRGNRINWKDLPPDKIVPFLDDPRPVVRRRAVRELGGRGAAAIPALSQALNSLHKTGRTNAVWALTRIEDPAARTAVRFALDDDEPVSVAALHSVSLWRDRAATAELAWMFKHKGEHVRRGVAEVLGRAGGNGSAKVLLQALGQSTDRVLEHSFIYALIQLADASATTEGLASPDPRVRKAAMVALDQMHNGGLRPQAVAAELGSNDASLRETAAWVAGRHPEWGDALAGALGQLICSAARTSESRSDLQQQLARLAKAPAIQTLLAGRLNDARAPVEERRLALGAMAASGLKELPQPWLDAITAVLAGKDTALLPDAVAAVRRLALPKDKAGRLPERIREVAARSEVPDPVRVEALAALPGSVGELSPDMFGFLTAHLSPQEPAAQRVMAADVLGRAKLSAHQLTALADALQNAGPLEIGRLLPAYEQSSDEPVGLRLVMALKGAKSLRSLRADMVRPRLAKFSPAVQKEAEPLLAELDPDAGAQRQRLEQIRSSLPQGDVRRGQAIFMSQKTACSTCHAIGYLGGNIGPDLTRVGSVRQERDLLESVVFPSASFVQSYEPTLVDTTDGDRQSGIVKKNDADEIVLVTGPTQEVRLPKSKVKEMRPGTVSVMPTGLDQQLSPQELADLLAFLKACR